ncbi:MAG: hypothetical protein QF676_02980 [Dehalococcoidia bacterium]|nr:hypothetical protein [Dehalococcoidia bacterium]
MVEAINKETGARVIGHSAPIKLVELLEQVHIDDVLPGYLDLVENHETDGELE